MLLIIAIYLLVNLSFLYVLPVGAIAGEEFAAGAVAGALFGDRGGLLVRVLTIVSMLSAINAYHLMASRVLFAMSRDGLVSGRPPWSTRVARRQSHCFSAQSSPRSSSSFGRTFEKVITVLAFFFIANYTLSFISLIVLRRREPDRPRPYRAWGYPWTTALALLGSVAFLIGAIAGDTRNSVYALLLLAASYPVFRLLGRQKTAPTSGV